MLNQSLIKTLTTINPKQGVKRYVMDPEQNARAQKLFARNWGTQFRRAVHIYGDHSSMDQYTTSTLNRQKVGT